MLGHGARVTTRPAWRALLSPSIRLCYRALVAKVGRALTIDGVRYRVLRLNADARARGPAFLLRSDRGDVYGLYRQGAQPLRLFAYALRASPQAIAFQELEFFDSEGDLTVARRTR